MPASQQRANEIVAYSKDFGEEATLEKFDISHNTLSRYRRLTNNFEAPKSVEDFDVPKNRLLEKIAEKYSDIELKQMLQSPSFIPTFEEESYSFEGTEITFGAFGDTHIGSQYTDESFIKMALDEFEKQGCSFIVHGGDVTEGMSGRDGHVYELTHMGYQEQKDAAIRCLSPWKKPIYMISGNHDLWYMKKGDIGANIVKDICEKLPNAHYLGMHEGDVVVGNCKIKLWHGEDASSYSTSYRLQKIVESLSGGEKPAILLCSHTHKQGYFFERNIQVVSLGSMQKQSAWMRYKRLAAHVGFFIIKMAIDREGHVLWFEPRWYPFYK